MLPMEALTRSLEVSTGVECELVLNRACNQTFIYMTCYHGNCKSKPSSCPSRLCTYSAHTTLCCACNFNRNSH